MPQNVLKRLIGPSEIDVNDLILNVFLINKSISKHSFFEKSPITSNL